MAAAALLLLAPALVGHGLADEVLFLKDGRKLVVKRLERREGRVYFETAQGESFFVAESEVVSPPLSRIPPARSVLLVLRDGRRVQVVELVREKGRVLFETVRGEIFSVPEADVVSPPLGSIGGRPRGRPAPAPPGPAPPPSPAPPAEPPPAAPPPAAPPAPPPFTTRFETFEDRWAIPFPESPRIAKGGLLDPYHTSPLKGDVPVVGDTVFLSLGLGLDLPLEVRGAPVRVGVASPAAASPDLLGEGSRLYSAGRASASAELFRGPAAFRPKDWAVKATGAFGLSYLRVASVPAEMEASRTESDFGLQEAFAEAKLLTLSPQYDFLSLRVGIQPFVSDFRGLVFNDANLGARLFGTAAGNRVQWNLGFFEMLAKRPQTRLLTLDSLGRQVAVADVFVLDVFPGYRLGAAVHRTRDDGGAVPGGPAAPLTVWHAGLVGEGPALGRGLSHAFHFAWGRDEGEPRFGRPLDIRAFLGALELHFDRDWARYRASFFFASGDGDPTDGKANGFDAVQDLPVFAGSTEGFWARAGIALPGAGVLLKPQDSLLPSGRTSKFGRPHFVNPGLVLAGLGGDFRLTPKWRARAGASFLRFSRPEALEPLLGLPDVRATIGIDAALTLRYRPRLDEHMAISAGGAVLFPGEGWRDLEPALCVRPGCAGAGSLWSGFVRLELLF